LGMDVEMSKKKKKKKTKSEDLEDEKNGESLLAEVQLSKTFVLASSTNPSKMKPSEWPLLLKVITKYRYTASLFPM